MASRRWGAGRIAGKVICFEKRLWRSKRVVRRCLKLSHCSFHVSWMRSIDSHSSLDGWEAPDRCSEGDFPQGPAGSGG